MKFIACNRKNYSVGRSSKIKYIVIHYTANNGDTSKGNCSYFKNNVVGASAHYFVDENEVCQSVADSNTAWAVGAKHYRHRYCRNGNSISIEMCSRKNSKGKYYIKEETVNRAIQLTKELMKKYNIPVENVLRHYDVTGKNCPAPFVENKALWTNFKAKLGSVGGFTTASNKTFVPYKCVVTANSLNVRSGIGVGYPVISVLKKGDVFTVAEVKNGWGKSKWYKDNGKEGWFNLYYTKKL